MYPTKATPWGAAQTSCSIAPGIVFHSTSSHGGFHLSDERRAAMPALLADIEPFAGASWYEEDCDWAIVALAFPTHFKPAEIWSAIRTVRGGSARLHNAVAYVESPEGAAVRAVSERFVIDSGHKYMVSSMSSSGKDGWFVSYFRISDGARAAVSGLSSDEVFQSGPHDLSVFGERVRYDDRPIDRTP